MEVLEWDFVLWQDEGGAWEHSQAGALVLLRFAITLCFSLPPVFSVLTIYDLFFIKIIRDNSRIYKG